MIFEPIVFLVAVPAVLMAGISKAGFGSGAAFIAGPILALYIDPRLALGLMLPLLMLIDVASLKVYWGKWDRADAGRLVLGALPGVAVGALFSQAADPDLFRLLIGAICLLFLLWQILRRSGRVATRTDPWPGRVGLMAGAFAGFTSFISHAGGPVVAMYLLSQKLDKTRYQATTVIAFWAINVVKFVPYAALGFFSAQTFLAGLILAPVALLGTWLGVRAHVLVPERVFFAITYVLLFGAGTKLIFDALS